MGKFDIKKYSEYYKTYKILYRIHQELFGKRAVPNLPSQFSENLCRWALNLKPYEGKDYDAQDFESKTYEIKGTCVPNTDTTISVIVIPDNYLWIALNVKEDQAIVYMLNREKVKEQIDKKVKNAQNKGIKNIERCSIDLNKCGGVEINIIKFGDVTIHKVK